MDDAASQGADDDSTRVPRFLTLLGQLRDVPALAPLFDLYKVPNPIVTSDDDEASGLIQLLHAVRITVASGTVTLTNRQTSGVIYSAPISALDTGTFNAANLPGATTSTCTYGYSDWSACQNGTQTRTVASASPAGCLGTPVLSQSCTVGTPPPPPPPPATCTAFTYSTWGACQPDGTQTRTILASSPSGCTGGAPVTTQACTYVPPVTTCTSFTYSAFGACQPDGTQTRAVLTSSPSGCTGGAPVTSQACTYVPPPPPTCSSFAYSAWGACQPDGIQTRTVVTSSPSGCTGGAPVTTQACTYTPPIDGAALYTQYCSSCHGALASSNLKGKNISVSLIQSMGMTQGLSTDQLQAIVTAVGP
jgi:hypothetical protein